MKTNGLVYAICCNNIDPMSDKNMDLIIGKRYVVDEIWVGQSHSSIRIGDKSYNSVLFDYFDLSGKPINIYREYSPYKNYKIKDKKISKYDGLILLDDIYKTIEDEVENKELAEFIIKTLKNERKVAETMVNYNETLQFQIKQFQNQNKGISNFSDEQLLEELSKRLGGKDE